MLMGLYAEDCGEQMSCQVFSGIHNPPECQERKRLEQENQTLRELLSLSKPFLTHNGLLIRIGAMGITADWTYYVSYAEWRNSLDDE